MGAAITKVAFPVPDSHLSRPELEARDKNGEVIWLYTRKDVRIPAVHIDFASREDQREEKSSWRPWSRRPSSESLDEFEGARAPSDRFVLLYSHGNGEDIALLLRYLEDLAKYTGCDIFAYEYPGYSAAQGSPSEQGCYDAIDAAWRHLTGGAGEGGGGASLGGGLGIPPERIVLFGRSLGSGPTVDLASRLGEGSRPAGVILQSPLESGARAVFGRTMSHVGFLLDIFKNYAKIGRVRTSVAIMHGVEDKVVPCANGRALFEGCAKPWSPLWIEGVGHNNMPDEDVFQYVRAYLEHLAELRCRRPSPSASPKAPAGNGRRGFWSAK